LHEAQARPFFPSQTVFLVLHREHGVCDAVSDASASDGSELSTGSAYFTLRARARKSARSSMNNTDIAVSMRISDKAL